MLQVSRPPGVLVSIPFGLAILLRSIANRVCGALAGTEKTQG